MKHMQENWFQNAVNEFLGARFEDGDLIEHDWLRVSLEIPTPTSFHDVEPLQLVWLQRFDAFRNYLLLEHKIALQSVPGHGYRIVPPNDQARYATEQATKQIARGIRQGKRLLNNARTNEMDRESARRHTDAQVKMDAISGIMDKQRESMFAVFEQREKIPDRPRESAPRRRSFAAFA